MDAGLGTILTASGAKRAEAQQPRLIDGCKDGMDGRNAVTLVLVLVVTGRLAAAK